ncbi:hypothetical protein BpHYR1_051296 [Brachionus plicatilis]|uniref:Uncharacterized protein n=1 Tax=Brachionus plicatilis TaxID=10195 RepID=A0A3M7Q7Q8_BRAPC|nr:hypothetical protein BpHYR1_051296 [Brachionus plicatilis]
MFYLCDSAQELINFIKEGFWHLNNNFMCTQSLNFYVTVKNLMALKKQLENLNKDLVRYFSISFN